LTENVAGVRKRTAAAAGQPVLTIDMESVRTERKPLKQRVQQFAPQVESRSCNGRGRIVSNRLAIVLRNCGTGSAVAKL
jgi:hypothetical protein